MSLNVALSTASESLRAITTKLSVSSSNIANADTDGYTTKTATQTTEVTSGVGSGVTVTGIVSKTDSWLEKSIVMANSETAATAMTSEYLDNLGDIFGAVSSDDDSTGSSLASYLTAVETALADLATTPESDSLKTQVVSTMDDAAATFRTLSDQIQDLRDQADGAIADAVDTINGDLNSLDQINDSIVKAQAAGQSTADLEDKRNVLLQDLSSQLGISYFFQDNGAVSIYTSSGQQLLGNDVHELSFTESGTVTATTTYPTWLSGVTINGVDITEEITSGNLSALITLRDETLVNVQTSLDTIAVDFMDTINNAYGTTLLTGSGASDIAVDSTILDTPTSFSLSDPQGMADDLSDAGVADDAATLIASVATMMDQADTNATAAETTLTTLTTRHSSNYGVNVDEETAKITELQNSYSATAQVISAVQSMFSDLLEAVR